MKNTIMVKEIYEAFKSVGADEAVASAAAQAVPPIENLATKADIAEVKAEIAEARGEVAEVKGEVAEVRGEVAEVRGEIAEVKGEVAKLRGEFAQLMGQFANHRGNIYWHLWLMGSGLLAAMVGLKLFE